MLRIKDRVKETTSSSGTTDFVLTGAFAANMQTFASKMATGDTTYYAAETSTQFEIGLATMLANGSLARTTVLDGTSGPGVKVNFTSSPAIFMTVPGALFDASGLNVFSVRSSAAQSVSNNVAAKVALNTKEWDSATAFDTVNYRFQPKVAGFYLINFGITGGMGGASFNGTFVNLYLNGADMPNYSGRGTWLYNGGVVMSDSGWASTKLVFLNGTTDYLELYGRIVGSGTLSMSGWMQGCLLNATPVGSGGAVFSAYQTVAQSIASGGFTKLSLPNKEGDTTGAFDATTNYRFQPTTAGWYQLFGGVAFATAATNATVAIFKNGVEQKRGSMATSLSCVVAGNVYLNGSTDYVELHAYQAGGVAVNTNPSAAQVYFQGALVSGNPPATDKARMFRAAAWNSTALASTKVPFDSVSFDTAGMADTTTGRITPKKPGYYQVSWRLEANVAGVERVFTTLLKNGADVVRGTDGIGGGASAQASVGSDTVYCNGTTDYLEVAIWTNPARAIGVGATLSSFNVVGPV